MRMQDTDFVRTEPVTDEADAVYDILVEFAAMIVSLIAFVSIVFWAAGH